MAPAAADPPSLLPRSTSTSSPVRPAATFPTSHPLPAGRHLDGVYPHSWSLSCCLGGPSGCPSLSGPVRAAACVLAKPPARAGLEPASSPGKGFEPRPLAPPAPATRPSPAPQRRASHPHHASPDQPAPPRLSCGPAPGKDSSKPFSIQELELRSLGKTTDSGHLHRRDNHASNCSTIKGPREGGSLLLDSPRDGKTSGPAAHPPVLWPKDIFRSLLFIFPSPIFVGFGILF